MKKAQRRAAKQKAHERRHRAGRQRRRESDVCAKLLYEADVALDLEQDTDGARQLLEKALRLRPSHTEARERLCELLFQTGRDDEGLAHYAQLSRPTDWPPLVHMAAVAAWRSGRFESAAALLSEFLDRTRGVRPLQPLRRAARTLLTECRKEIRRAKRLTARATPVAEALPLLRDVDTEPAPVPASVTPAAPPKARHAEAEPPPFPTVPMPALEIRVDVHDREFLAGVAPGQAQAPVRDVLLRRDYARLRLQKGFDELVSLAAIHDVVHFRYQLETVRRILRDFRGRVLLADEVGLGKTIEACLALKGVLAARSGTQGADLDTALARQPVGGRADVEVRFDARDARRRAHGRRRERHVARPPPGGGLAPVRAPSRATRPARGDRLRPRDCGRGAQREEPSHGRRHALDNPTRREKLRARLPPSGGA